MDLIDRNAFAQKIVHKAKHIIDCGQHEIDVYDVLIEALLMLENMPIVDAEPVRHGHWIKKMYTCHCSECQTIGNPQWKRCPVCETKMDLKENGK